MITEPIRRLIEKLSYIFVATTDSSGQPHMAIGEQVIVLGDSFLVFENWFCPCTLQNIASNSHVSVVVVLPGTGNGYQMLGTVIRSTDTAFLDGYDPAVKMPDTPQVLTRFTVRVERILEFASGIHSDVPVVE
jgi:hypothetical protein